MVNLTFRQHGIVLKLGLSNWGGVRRDEDQLGFAGSQGLDG
jgi:hypothetical protein